MLPIIMMSVLYGANIEHMPVEWAIGIPVAAIALSLCLLVVRILVCAQAALAGSANSAALA